MYREELELARSLAHKAGARIMELRRDAVNLNIIDKGNQDLVTAADLESEKIIISGIKSKFPSHKILSEESSEGFHITDYMASQLWIIDPIDGTTDYAHGLKQCNISIAYYEHGVAKAAVVYAPFLDETFTAISGAGAFLNGKELCCSKTTSLENALVIFGTNTLGKRRSNFNRMMKHLESLLTHCRDIRRLGAAAIDLCYVAAGRVDAFCELALSPWDVAAGGLIAAEAGAVKAAIKDGNIQSEIPFGLYAAEVLVCNPSLLPKLKEILI